MWTRFFMVQPVNSCNLLLLCALRHGYVKEIAYLNSCAHNEASAAQDTINMNASDHINTTTTTTTSINNKINEKSE